MARAERLAGKRSGTLERAQDQLMGLERKSHENLRALAEGVRLFDAPASLLNVVACLLEFIRLH